ncbi:uncharacterized protein TNCV_1165411 [Trichonephila clavipes]|nr:uncharacterized protein TNCV_1165411 [Trichonephila clavipes]
MYYVNRLRYNSDVRASVILLENYPLNAVHEWQCYRMNYQIDVQIAVSVFGITTRILLLSYLIAPQTLTPGACPVCPRLCLVPWPPSDQHIVITGTKAVHAFIRKHNRCPLRPPLASETAMSRNTHYKAPGSELSLK